MPWPSKCPEHPGLRYLITDDAIQRKHFILEETREKILSVSRHLIYL